MNIPQMREAIRRGDFDEHLDKFYNVALREYRRRKKEINESLVDDFAVGQKVVTLPGNYKPRYMFNRKGTVIEVEAPWVWIELDQPIFRNYRGKMKTIAKIGVSPMYLAFDE